MAEQKFKLRAIVCDIDGTLVGPQQPQPSARLLAALARAQQKGILVVVATGRIRQVVPPALADLADYCVCGNGGILQDRAGKVLHLCAYEPQLVEELTRFAQSIGGALCFSFPSGYGAYCGYDRLVRLYGEEERYGVIADDSQRQDRHLTEPPFSAFLVGNEGRVYKYLRGQPKLQGAQQEKDYFDIYPVATNKAAGVTKALQLHGIDWKEAVVFGDSNNDLEMLAAGQGYAMANACPEAKIAAGQEAPPQWEDGVAQVLEALWAAGN